jgi:hypothetical protein
MTDELPPLPKLGRVTTLTETYNKAAEEAMNLVRFFRSSKAGRGENPEQQDETQIVSDVKGSTKFLPEQEDETQKPIIVSDVEYIEGSTKFLKCKAKKPNESKTVAAKMIKADIITRKSQRWYMELPRGVDGLPEFLGHAEWETEKYLVLSWIHGKPISELPPDEVKLNARLVGGWLKKIIDELYPVDARNFVNLGELSLDDIILQEDGKLALSTLCLPSPLSFC